jgi:fumarate hydratase subunit beta
LEEGVLEGLTAGDEVIISGRLLAARDQAHKRLVDLVEQGLELPFDPVGQIIYYVGPTPARPGRVIGAAGPTTSGRMDLLTVPLLRLGLKGLLGKGRRSGEVKKALMEHRAIYLAAFGGAGAFYAQRIRQARILAWPELGPEALMELMVEDFPAVVINDLSGGDLYQSGPAAWRS